MRPGELGNKTAGYDCCSDIGECAADSAQALELIRQIAAHRPTMYRPEPTEVMLDVYCLIHSLYELVGAAANPQATFAPREASLVVLVVLVVRRSTRS